MATHRELADLGIVKLIEHIKSSDDLKSKTYSEFAEMIGWFRKDGLPMARGVGKVLGILGRDLLDFDRNAPRVTVLVKKKDAGKETGKPNVGFETFVAGWSKMDPSEQENLIAQEKAKIKAYERAGKFDEFLRVSQNRTIADFEFSSRQEKHDYTVADGVSVKKHREFEYKIRNQRIVNLKKAESGYICECCGFDFEKTYGMRYIECHHIKPLANSRSGEGVGLADLAALCANCHRIIHQLLSQNKKKYENDYPQSIKDLRREVENRREPSRRGMSRVSKPNK